MKLPLLAIFVVFLTGLFYGNSTQEHPYPNELVGFEFFNSGKLKNFKLGKSTKKDVEMIFGESCGEYCDYDENYKIKFEYLKSFDDCMTTYDIRDRFMCPLNKFVGTVSSITLKPMKRFSFIGVPKSKFKRISGNSISEKGGGLSISYSSFTDKDGLSYLVYSEISGATDQNMPIFKKGDIYSIKYNFTHNTIRKIFVVEYLKRKNERKK